MVRYKRPGEFPFRREEYRQEEIEDLYQMKPSSERPIIREKPLPEERIVSEVRVKTRATPHLEEQVIRPLKLLGGDVIGSLFERVTFIKKRIDEITETLSLREKIHQDMTAEIDLDIREKENFSMRAIDIDEKRNFKLDISILRKEKRLETVQYWRDVVELRSELRSLLEKYETETKILAIFKEVNTGGTEL